MGCMGYFRVYRVEGWSTTQQEGGELLPCQAFLSSAPLPGEDWEEEDAPTQAGLAAFGFFWVWVRGPTSLGPERFYLEMFPF